MFLVIKRQIKLQVYLNNVTFFRTSLQPFIFKDPMLKDTIRMNKERENKIQ